MNEDLVTISRLALSGNDIDLRLFLAKFIRKNKSIDSATTNAIEDLLKTNKGNSSFMRKNQNSNITNNLTKDDNSDNVLSLLKFWDYTSDLEEIYLSSVIRSSLNLITLERMESNLQLLSKNGLKPITTAIFQGPPGVGKSLAAKWLSKSLKLPLFTLDLTTIMSSYMGKTGNNIRKVLDFAKSKPCILFLDEIDAIAKSRSDNSDVGELKRIVTILLQELESWPEQGLLLAATNHVDLIDPALWRRFDLELTFRLPDSKNLDIAIKDYFAEDYKFFEPWIPLIKLNLENSSYSLVKRKITYLRKLKLMNSNLNEELILKELLPDISRMTRQEKINIAVKLITTGSFTQSKIASMFNISRDTLRKYSK